jgi:hypothetical protein
VIPKAGVTAAFIVHILISKYVDHIPLDRQANIDARSGWFIGRNARWRYVEAAALLLLDIYEALKQLVLTGVYIHIDEAYTKLLDPDRRGKARDAYFWGFYAPFEQAIIMEFSTSRSAKVLQNFLGDNWSGVAQSDGAMMYSSVFEDRPYIIHLECIGHLRRYVLAAVEAGHKEAIPLFEDISELYAIETEAKLRGLTPAQRGLLRHAKAKPVLKRLQKGFLKLKKRSEPLLGKLEDAVTYATNRWSHLAAYAKVDRGYVDIDQNPIERLWRPGKVGLNNYMFIGHPDAGQFSAVIYTIVSTCRLLEVNPEDYLLWVLPKLAAGTTDGAQGLLPHDFKRLIEARASTPSQQSRPVVCDDRPIAGSGEDHKAHRPRDGSELAA